MSERRFRLQIWPQRHEFIPDAVQIGNTLEWSEEENEHGILPLCNLANKIGECVTEDLILTEVEPTKAK